MSDPGGLLLGLLFGLPVLDRLIRLRRGATVAAGTRLRFGLNGTLLVTLRFILSCALSVRQTRGFGILQ